MYSLNTLVNIKPGDIIEITSNESSIGKTLLALSLSKDKGLRVYCQYEDTYEVNDNSTIIFKGTFNNLLELLNEIDDINYLVIDSFPSLILNNYREDLFTLFNLTKSKNITVIITNQFRSNLKEENSYYKKDLLDWIDYKIVLSFYSTIKKDIVNIGRIIKAKILGVGTFYFPMIYNKKVIDLELDLILTAIKRNIITRKGSYFFFNGMNLGSNMFDCKNKLDVIKNQLIVSIQN